MVKRFVCIHGHFYQPPRENPGLGIVLPQPTAAPYSDWNERVTAECYAPNARARVLDPEGRLAEVVNNYEWLSFDFGPTLLAWMERHAPATLDAVLAGDRASRRRVGGDHGGALAHPFHHSILPLADPVDRAIEIRWGIRDFERRFGRKPEGMWLPETAVDLATLDAVAKEGIGFTLLSPRQAKRVRPVDPSGPSGTSGPSGPSGQAGGWKEVPDGTIDTRRPYLVRLPSGRSIAVFFYHGSLSQAVAFEHALGSADALVERMIGAFDPKDPEAQLVTIGTDGESYGHHHRFGDMALARAIALLRARRDVEITTPGAFLAANPPRREVELIAPSAWSCAHGVERWRSDCGCRLGPPSSQAWRAPLREALETLRAAATARIDEALGPLLPDAGAAMDDAYELLATGPHATSEAIVEAFLARHASPARSVLSSAERARVLELLEARRHGLAMFTSCAFFFDDVAGIETQQVLAHADRVIELVERALNVDLSPVLLEPLAAARSNDSEAGDGARIFAESVRPERGDAERVAKHVAMLSLLDPPLALEVCGFRIQREDAIVQRAGKATLGAGIAHLTSLVSGRVESFTHAVLDPGGDLFHGFVLPGVLPDWLRAVREALARAEDEARAAIGTLSRGEACSLDWLLPADRPAFLEHVLRREFRDLRAIEKRIGGRSASLTAGLVPRSVALPAPIARACRQAEMEWLLDALDSDVGTIVAMLESSRDPVPPAAVAAPTATESGVERRLLARLCAELREALATDDDGARLRAAAELARAAYAWRDGLDRHAPQEALLDASKRVASQLDRSARSGDERAKARLAALRDLGELLRVRIAP